MKTLEIIRNNSSIKFRCDNGDVYDANAKLTDDNDLVIYSSEYWSTLSTHGYKGGVLSKGRYYGIASHRTVSYQPEPIRVIRLFQIIPGVLNIKSIDDIPDSSWTLPSDIPNPNHNNLPLMEQIQCHPGNTKWNWSEGCMTALNYGGHNEFDKLMNCLIDNEIISIRLS